MPGISLAVSILARLGLSQAKAERLAPLALVVGLIALAGLLWGGFQAWDWWDDRQAVEADRNASNAAFRGRQVEVERQAGAGKDARDRADAGKQDHLEDRVNEANKHGGTAADDVWNGGLWDEPAR